MSAPAHVPDSEVHSPLLYLSSPQLARETATATYVHVGATAVFLWDVANNLRNDYRIIFRYRIGIQTWVYYLSRITLLVFSLGRLVLITSPIQHCGKLQQAMNAVMVVFVSLTTLTFYLRIYAIYRDKIFVKIFFGILWLATAGVSVTLTQTFTSEHIGPTNYCMDWIKNFHFMGPVYIILLVNDTLIYMAIAYRLYTILLDVHSRPEQKPQMVVFGTSLPVFWKAIFHYSQLYFLIIVVTKAFLVYSVNNFKVPMSNMYVICHQVLVNILSGRIFRATKMDFDQFERPLSPEIGPRMDFAANTSFVAERSRPGRTFTSRNPTTSQATSTDVESAEKKVITLEA
ncbi:hypothetical protein CPC08DRAFT_706331 [Agrocybe pediades]|nr:hypothetical protein CPC08DRAFT_706331 [Agrocybe pediades]